MIIIEYFTYLSSICDTNYYDYNMNILFNEVNDFLNGKEIYGIKCNQLSAITVDGLKSLLNKTKKIKALNI